MSFDSGKRLREIERKTLRALCQENGLREFAREALRNYRWRDPVHQVIFEILIALPRSSTSAVLREQLPIRLTRWGFPDVTYEDFFQPLEISVEEAESLIRELRDSS